MNDSPSDNPQHIGYDSNLARLALVVLATILACMRASVDACYLIVGAVVLGALVSRRFGRVSSERFSVCLLGAAVSALSFLGFDAIVVAALLVIAWIGRGRVLHLGVIAPIVTLSAVWCVAEGWWARDWQIASLIFSSSRAEAGLGAAIRALRDWAQYAAPQSLGIALAMIRLVSAWLLFVVLSARQDLRSSFRIGLALTAIVSAVWFALSMVWGSGGAELPEYWSAARRFAGPFRDPNALGVFCVLLLPLVFCDQSSTRINRYLSILAALSALVLGLWSGSRSFALGLALFGVCWVGTRFRAGLRLVPSRAWTLALACAALAVVVMSPPVLSRILIPEGLANGGVFASRIAFWRIAFEVWLDNPLFGVGMEQFRDVVTTYAARLSIPLGAWVDNSNSFYLGILAEGGLLAAGAWLLGVVGVGPRAEHVFPANAAVAVFACLLIFGPHLEFAAVAYAFAGVAAYGYTVIAPGTRMARARCLWWLGFVLCLPLIVAKSYFAEHGLYRWEHDQRAGWVRWAAPVATVTPRCTNGLSTIVLRDQAPPSVIRELSLAIIGDDFETSAILQRGELKELSVSCPSGRDYQVLTLIANRFWTPAKEVAGSSDHRPLALQVFGSP